MAVFSTRIDVIMLISGLSGEELESRHKSLIAYASPGTEIRLVLTRNAPGSVESMAEMELAAPGILERAVQSEREGADTIVIWGGHDPSLTAARELVSIPVVAPGMASMYMACMLADRFSLLVQLPNVIGLAKRQVRDLGLGDRCVGVYSVGIPVLRLGKPESYIRVREAAVASIDKGGADAICFGCMGLDNHAERLAKELEETHPGVLVIPPGKAAVRLAELIVGLGLSQSKRSYPFPPKDIKFPSP